MAKRHKDFEFLVRVGARIKAVRKAKGLSIEGLYEKCTGLNRSSLSRIERGLTDPQITTLKRIADSLEVPLQFLIEVDKAEI